MVGRSEKLTPADRARFTAMGNLPCVACKKLGLALVCGPTTRHHLLSGGRRRGHQDSVILGLWHHQAYPLEGWSSKDMEAVFGPSLATSPKRFRAEIADDETLLAMTNQMLDGIDCHCDRE